MSVRLGILPFYDRLQQATCCDVACFPSNPERAWHNTCPPLWIHYPSPSPLPIPHLPPNFIVTTCGNLSEQRLIFISVNYCVDTSYRWSPAFISYFHLQLLVNRGKKGRGHLQYPIFNFHETIFVQLCITSSLVIL